MRRSSFINALLVCFLLQTTGYGMDQGHVCYHSAFAPGNPRYEEGDFPRYAPDRKVDITNVLIDVTPHWEQRTIDGYVEIDFTPIALPLSQLRLDAVDLNVLKLTATATVSDYEVSENNIVITFSPSLEPGQAAQVQIRYTTQPKQGLYFRTPELGYPAGDIHLFTQGQTHTHPHWFPAFDYPNERSSSEIICRVPPEMMAVSNGVLVSEEIDPQTGLKAVHWRQEKPHVNYLIALVAGKFAKLQANYQDIPMAFYTQPSMSQYAHNSFQDTVDMMGFFEQEIGVPYPWAKYDQAIVTDFTSGGMENTTLTIMTHRTLFPDETENIRSSQNLVAHELVHQWFGDLLTCKDWSHIWLNESFATFYAHLYNLHKNGQEDFLYGLYLDARRRVLHNRSVELPIVYREYENSWEQFDYRTYPKGSWVLHMLRSQLGPELYRKVIQTYVERHALTSVVTEDLVAVIEEVSGRSFDRFIDQWIYHAGWPKLKINYDWNGQTRLAHLRVRQTQTGDDSIMIFHFPTTVRFYYDQGYEDRAIEVNRPQQDFYFALEQQPRIVRFDPEFSLLAEIDFNKPRAMLLDQLKQEDDMIGRVLAIESLEDKDDHDVIEALSRRLHEDAFWGVRVRAARALGDINTDEAFLALTGALNQPDARARQAVTQAIGDFYRPDNLDWFSVFLGAEKNPDIKAAAIRGLGLYHYDAVEGLLLMFLRSESFRNTLAMAAIYAIERLDEPGYIDVLMETLTTYEDRFVGRDLGRALQTLARIADELDDKSQVRKFILSYLDHPVMDVKTGAIRALGDLGDARVLSIVRTFEKVPDRRMPAAARAAVRALERAKDNVPDELIELRQKVGELEEDYEDLQQTLQKLEDKLNALQE